MMCPSIPFLDVDSNKHCFSVRECPSNKLPCKTSVDKYRINLTLESGCGDNQLCCKVRSYSWCAYPWCTKETVGISVNYISAC